MMRASMGKAVIDMAAPMNSIASQPLIPGAKSGKRSASSQAMPQPRRKGVRMPAQETAMALRTRWRMSPRSNSRPTRNM